jgi:outer membrane protein assembly factor BamB
VQGFTPSQVLNDGTDAVALGLLGGTPRLVGFDPDRKLVRWQRALASAAVPLGADLVERVLFVPQQLAAGRTLLALDAATGQLRWQASIPGQGMGGAAWERVIASGDRVYVPALTGLTLLDAHTGARLGVLGR